MRGPNIKKMTQLIASYFWDKKKLGPTIAKQSLGELFEDESYDIIRETPPELAYQIYLVDKNMDDCLKDLALSKKYIKNFI